jgi:hypothetical protein
LARGLAGEILNILKSEKSGTPDSDLNEPLQSLRGLKEIKAAQILLLKLSNNTETPERNPKKTHLPNRIPSLSDQSGKTGLQERWRPPRTSSQAC